MSEYLSCANTAKLIRASLKKAFPGVKFFVRSHTYSGGASIDVDWTDGPSQREVEKVAKVYAGGGFDGMIDMKYHVDAWLMPDGSAQFAHSSGTEGSRGVVPAFDNPQPHPDAKKVSFGADFVFCHKHRSFAVYKAAVEGVCKNYGVEMPEVVEGSVDPYINGYVYVPNADLDLNTLVHRELQKENA